MHRARSSLEARGRKIRSRVVHASDGPTRRMSSPEEGHRIYPYQKHARPREVYAADITYIPMAKGFLYLVVVIDSARRSPTGSRTRWTPPSASKRWKRPLSATAHLRSSPIRERSLPPRRSPVRSRRMACASLKGRWLDNVKQEEVYRRAYETVRERELPTTCATLTKSVLTMDLTTDDATNESRCPKRITPRDSTLKNPGKTVQILRTISHRGRTRKRCRREEADDIVRSRRAALFCAGRSAIEMHCAQRKRQDQRIPRRRRKHVHAPNKLMTTRENSMDTVMRPSATKAQKVL